MIPYQLSTTQMVGLWLLVCSVIGVALLLGDAARVKRERRDGRRR